LGSREFSSDVIVANEYTILGANSKYGVVTVGTAAVELKVGASKLTDRTTLSIQALKTNSDLIYIGLDNTVTTSKFGLFLEAGTGIELGLSTSVIPSIFAISGTAGQKVSIIEGKSV
jgi:hypothetical protein